MPEWIQSFLHQFSPEGIQDLVQTYGTAGIALIVFVETGLLVGFFLPGDSLLVTAGLVAATHGTDLNLWMMILVISIAAVVGDALGFWIGARAGPKLFKRDDSRFFKRKHLLRAHAFYEKYGGKTIVLARFVPIIRTFAPTVAGAAGMNYRRFVIFNVFGGLGWVASMLLCGYLLGGVIGKERLSKYLLLIILLVIFLSILPGIIEIIRERRRAAAESAGRV